MIAPLSKVCKQCGADKPLTDYTPMPSGRLGRAARCKPCLNKIQKEVYAPRFNSGKAKAEKKDREDEIELGLAILRTQAKPGVPFSLAHIAAYMGVTRERARQIMEEALKKVRLELMRRGEWAEIQGAFRDAFANREEGMKI